MVVLDTDLGLYFCSNISAFNYFGDCILYQCASTDASVNLYIVLQKEYNQLVFD